MSVPEIDNATLGKSYPAMAANPYSILSTWDGEWKFVSCFETESAARESLDHLTVAVPNPFRGQPIRYVLRNRQSIIERAGFG